jgi:hypothetical protein
MPDQPAVTPQARLTFWEAMLRIPRQVVYLFIALAVIVPLFVPFLIRPQPMEPVVSLYNVIDSMPRGRALVISVDYTPDIEPELHPMTIALLRHAFARRLKVGVLCLQIPGIGLADMAINQVVEEFNSRAKTPEDSLRYGVDYVFWGFQTPPLMVLTGMGEDITKVFPVDAHRTRTDSLPISREIRNYNNIGMVVSIAGSNLPLSWVTYAQTVFGVKIGTGITAVSAADFYPYYSKTRQFSGLLAGMKGAAEYEQLVADGYPQSMAGLRRVATERMASQTTAHIAIMLLIIIGNVAFFATRKRKVKS